jgi:hypothetical protein
VTLKLVIFPFLIGIISSILCSLSACVRLLLFSEDDFLLLVDSAVGAWSAHWLSGITCCYKFMCMGEGSPFQKFCFLIELMWHVKQNCIHCGCDVRLLLPTIWRFNGSYIFLNESHTSTLSLMEKDDAWTRGELFSYNTNEGHSLRCSQLISRLYKGRKPCVDVFLRFGWMIWWLSCFCSSLLVLYASSTNSTTKICKIGRIAELIEAFNLPEIWYRAGSMLHVLLGRQLFSAYSPHARNRWQGVFDNLIDYEILVLITKWTG